MMISLLIHTISGDIQFFTLRKLVATLMNLLRLCKMTADIHGNLLFDTIFEILCWKLGFPSRRKIAPLGTLIE